MASRRDSSLLGAAFIVLALVAACSAPARRPPNVLWVVWDTVRADHLSPYGYGRPTTPRLARWAAGARVYDDCLSAAGHTLPSHASMFTGLWPSEHCANNAHPQLDPGYTTLAELLHGAGYQTYMWSANPNVSRQSLLDQGFDRVEHPWDPAWADEATRIVRAKLPEEDRSSELGSRFQAFDRGETALTKWSIKAAGELAGRAVKSWLEAADRRRPFLVFVNYMEAHRPYIPAREHRARVMSADEVTRSYGVDRSWLPMWEYTFGLRDYTDEELALTRATYDATLTELDDLFGDLLDTLDADGYLDDTVIVLTADHGEHLGEQHMLDHQYSVYQALLRVPLIVKYPSRFSPGRETRPVMNVDLFPTLLELAGVAPAEGRRSRAVSLLAPLETRERLAEEPAPSDVGIATVKQAHPEWDPARWLRTLRGLVAGGEKLVAASDGKDELYDVHEDPWETHELAADRLADAQRMHQALDRLAGTLTPCAPPTPGQPMLSPEERERLKALGYLK
jgi:arylsulfatase A-like enzyme